MVAGAALAALVSAIACGNAAPNELGNGVSAGQGDGGAVGCTASPEQGCACPAPGTTAACGRVSQHASNYTSCSMGHIKCGDDGKWGECQGEQIVMKGVGGGLHPLDLAGDAGASCASRNPCDPSCVGFDDTPAGLDAGIDTGIATNDAGLTLVGVVGQNGIACTGVSVTPTPQTLTVTQLSPVSPSTLSYAAAFIPAACYAGAPSALWSVDKFDRATIGATGTLTVAYPIAGPIQVTAYAGNWSGAALANIKVSADDNSGAPSGGNVTSFGINASGTAATGVAGETMTILYPFAGTVLPLGLQAPLLQWQTGALGAAQAVRVCLRWPADPAVTQFRFCEVVPENSATPIAPSRPRAVIPQTVWQLFEKSARNSDATLGIQRLVGGGAGTLYKEKTLNIHFADGQLKGTVYYNSYGTNAATNYCCKVASSTPFGAATLAITPGAAAPTLVAGNNTNCRVCHTVSADGSRLVTNRGDTFVDSVTKTLSPLGAEANIGTGGGGIYAWPALYPDGSFLFSNSAPANSAPVPNFEGSSNAPSKLYALPGGAAITSTGLPANLGAAMPAFSVDGKKVAFNFYGGVGSDKKSLAVMDFANATKTFSGFTKVATPTGGSPAYWPSFLPTPPAGQNYGVVYERETRVNGRDWGGTRGDVDGAGHPTGGTLADLWWVDLGASSTVTQLAKANGVGNYDGVIATIAVGHNANDVQRNYEPTVNPQPSGGYSWMIFTSRRAYGNVAVLEPYASDPRFDPITTNPTPKKLWVSALDPSKPPGTDPSAPAFYLPGQELLAGNARAYWVLDACKAPSASLTAANLCEIADDCCGALATPPTAACRLDPPPLASPPTRHCVPVVSNVCVPNGGACTADAQCCNFPASACASGTCQTLPPVISYPPADWVRDYPSNCPAGTHVVWHAWDWETTTAGNSFIDFYAQSADTQANLATATSVYLGRASGATIASPFWGSVDVATKDAANAPPVLPTMAFLRITAQLRPSTPGSLQAPVLNAWRQSYSCPPSE
jgi:hypothetical protein